MTDKKLTDAEIKKALEICSNENGMCAECAYSDDYTTCNTRIAKDTLDLINRQNAENERLQKSNRNWRRKVQRFRAILAGDNK